MNRRIILSPDARAHLFSNALWYHHIEAALAFRFRTEVQTTLRRLAQFPYASSCIGRTSERRASMHRFRYYIYFDVTTDSVLVRGIIHQRRADTVWEERQERSGQ